MSQVFFVFVFVFIVLCCCPPQQLFAVADVSSTDTALLYQSAGAPGVIAGVFPFSTDIVLLGRTWRVVVSPSQSFAYSTTAMMLSRTVGFALPVSVCAVSCVVLIAFFVRRNRLVLRGAKQFESYVSSVPRLATVRTDSCAFPGGIRPARAQVRCRA